MGILICEGIKKTPCIEYFSILFEIEIFLLKTDGWGRNRGVEYRKFRMKNIKYRIIGIKKSNIDKQVGMIVIIGYSL